MVSSSQTFLIDTTFILRKATDAFHGAQLLVVDGKDYTFVYGFIRDLLLARRALGISRGILVVGLEGHDVSTDNDVTAVVEFARVLGLPVVHKLKKRLGHLQSAVRQSDTSRYKRYEVNPANGRRSEHDQT